VADGEVGDTRVAATLAVASTEIDVLHGVERVVGRRRAFR